MEQLIGTSLDRCSTTEDEIYLIHRDSVVSAEPAARHFAQVAALLRHAAGTRDYLADVSKPKVQELSRREIEEIADARQIAAAYRVPERSVSTNWIADRMVEAIAAERLIEPRLHSLVTGVKPADGSKSGQWMVETGTTSHGPFDYVVNALWEGKLAIDATVGLAPQSEWSHRYRLALFIRTRRPVESPTVVVMTGPFGDAKRFSDRDFYLSWYPAGLVADDRSLEPSTPPLDDAIREQIKRSTVTKLVRSFREPMRSTSNESLCGSMAAGCSPWAPDPSPIRHLPFIDVTDWVSSAMARTFPSTPGNIPWRRFLPQRSPISSADGSYRAWR
jgi:hypothetical protein